MGSKEMNAVGVGDERQRPIDQFGDDLGDRERQSGAESAAAVARRQARCLTP